MIDNKNLHLFKRDNIKRIFANRDIYMEKIKVFGFDLDHTIVEYISPQYEELVLKYAIKHLIEKGYSEELTKIKYCDKSNARGVIYDTKFGNFLKVDQTGNILTTIYGKGHLDVTESRELYTDRYIDLENKKRYIFFNSLFELPSMQLICEIIGYFNNNKNFKKNETNTGFVNGSVSVTYLDIYEDVKEIFEKIFYDQQMKDEVLQDLPKYVVKDSRLPMLLDRMKHADKKIFLLTNNDYAYTNKVLDYLFTGSSTEDANFPDYWKEYFDLVIVDANKSRFFSEGSSLRRVHPETGKKSLENFDDKTPNKIFSGGNSIILCKILNCHGKEIMYVGDHILTDDVKSKKKQAWRTFLIVPELVYEMNLYIKHQEYYEDIHKMDWNYCNANKNQGSHCIKSPVNIQQHITTLKTKTSTLEDKYGLVGSLFRCGFRQTYFACKVSKFADLYSHTFLNLLYYPFFYLFRSPPLMLTHELSMNIETNIEKTDRIIQFIGMRMQPSFD